MHDPTTISRADELREMAEEDREAGFRLLVKRAKTQMVSLNSTLYLIEREYNAHHRPAAISWEYQGRTVGEDISMMREMLADWRGARFDFPEDAT